MPSNSSSVIFNYINSNTDQNYKLIQACDAQLVVPRERYLKAQLNDYLGSYLSEHKLHLRGYRGSYTHTKCNTIETQCQSCQKRRAQMSADELALDLKQNDPRTVEYLAVNSLPVFDDCSVEDMKNGHVHNPGESLVKRALVLIDEQSQIIQGGISYTINIETGICEIEVLGVKTQRQQMGFGSILLSGAVYTALQYGCTEFELLPRVEAIPFYLKHGFNNNMIGAGINLQEYFENAQYKRMMECYIYESEYSTKLTTRMQIYNPAINPVTICETQERLIDKLESQFQDVIDDIRNSLFKEGWRQHLDNISTQFSTLNKSLMISKEITDFAPPNSEWTDNLFENPVASICYARDQQSQNSKKLSNVLNLIENENIAKIGASTPKIPQPNT